METTDTAPKSSFRTVMRRIWSIEQLLVFIGVVLYAILVVTNQHPMFGIMMLCILVIGNLLIPLGLVNWRLYGQRPFPWNWIIFVPVQLFVGFACAALTVFFLQITKIARLPFWTLFHASGPLIIVVCMVSGSVLMLVEHVQASLRQKNELLERTVEKGTLALEQQEQELNRAREIQQMLLPNTLPQVVGAQIAAAWQPARTVGGDYFDVIRLDENRLGICVGDVAGKGITAALLMANLQASFRAFATPDATPDVVCSKLNKFLCNNVAAGKFVTFFYAILDVRNLSLHYENAGHCPGLLQRQRGGSQSLAGDGAVLGVLSDWNYRAFTVSLQRGDKLLFFTDGIVEAENSAMEEFGEQRLLHISARDHSSAVEMQRSIMQQVTEFCGGNFRDDATLLVVTIA
jgi:sigma-B regulation protein RsbU (phosphoserine phosphatase)